MNYPFLEERGRKWMKQFQIVGEVRGLGGMCAIELVKNPATREPAAEETKKVAQYCYEQGLITITAGTYGNVMRILVPLVVTDAQFEEGLDVLEAALCDAFDARAGVGAARRRPRAGIEAVGAAVAAGAFTREVAQE